MATTIDYVLLFASIHDVMAAENALQGSGLWCDMIPTPRELSSNCGMAIQLRDADWPVASELLAHRPVKLRGAYRWDGGRYIELSP